MMWKSDRTFSQSVIVFELKLNCLDNSIAIQIVLVITGNSNLRLFGALTHTPAGGMPTENETRPSFAQGGNIICYCCGEQGHRSPQYLQKNEISCSKWYVNRSLQNLQNQEEDGEYNVSILTNRSSHMSSSRNINSHIFTGL